MVAVCLVLQEVANLPYRAAVILHSHQQRVTDPGFLHLHQPLVVSLYLLSRLIVTSRGSFNLHSLMSNDIECIFLHLNCCLCIFFYEISLYVFLPIFSNFFLQVSFGYFFL